MTRPSVVLDFDGVLADTDATKRAVAHQLGLEVPNRRLDRSSMEEVVAAEVYERISRAATSREGTVQTAPTPGALVGVATLRSDFDVSILTSRRGSNLIAARRWVENLPATAGLPVVGVDTRLRKQDIAREARALAIVDDDLRNLECLGPRDPRGVLFSLVRTGTWVRWGVRVVHDWPALVELLYQLRSGVPAPSTATLEVGRRCQLECKHCFSHSGPDVQGDEETEGILERLRSLAAMDVRTVWLSGGEPTLRRDFAKIVLHAAGLGMECLVSSNGLVSRGRAVEIARLPIRRIDVGLDGTGLDHDALRGEGAFKRAMHGVRSLIEADVATGFSLHLRRQMQVTLEAMARHLGPIGIPVKIAPLLPVGRGVDLRSACPDWDEFEGWARRLVTLLPEGLGSYSDDACWAGSDSIAVNARGQIVPCCFHSDMELGHARPGQVGEIWTSSGLLQDLRASPPRGCTACDLRARYGDEQHEPQSWRKA